MAALIIEQYLGKKLLYVQNTGLRFSHKYLQSYNDFSDYFCIL